jgi:hypothetical protein
MPAWLQRVASSSLRMWRAVDRHTSVRLESASDPSALRVALADARAVARHWPCLLTVGLLTLCASIVTAEDQTLNGPAKVILVIFGAGTGSAVFVGLIVFAGALLRAPYRQRDYLRGSSGRSAAEGKKIALVELQPGDTIRATESGYTVAGTKAIERR